ncbi:threonine dehydratase biosynthetic, chloroplastic, partial [Paramuricea clavata]
EEKLDKHLAKFWFAAKTKDGHKYKVGSLQTIRYSLNRALKSFGHKFDITKRECTAFTSSIKAYEDASKELKQEGKGFTKNHEAINTADLFDIYHSRYLDPDIGPRHLQKKVQFDIRYYFARRGAENMPKMTKTTFAVKLDEKTAMKYVIRAEDEATKNHKANENDIVSGRMPSMVDKKYCPVRSFIMYTVALHPTSEKLWQTPKFNLFPTDGQKVWYGPSNVGHNSLDSFMSKLAKSCGFAQKGYTNHNLRASGVTTLKRNNYNDKQIMSITGHRSSASLAIYQKVASDEKLRMGCALGYALTGDSSCLTKQDEISSVYQQCPRETSCEKSAADLLRLARFWLCIAFDGRTDAPLLNKSDNFTNNETCVERHQSKLGLEKYS